MKNSKKSGLLIAGRIFLLLAVVAFSLGSGGVSPVHAAVCYSLAIDYSPSVGGTVTINTPSNCAGGLYNDGTVVTLTAVPGSQYGLLGWAGTNSNFSNPTTVTMNANKSVTAMFVPKNDAIGGAVTINSLTYQDTVNVDESVDDDLYNPVPPENPRGLCVDLDEFGNKFHINEGFRSLWYKYTPPEKQTIQADTIGSLRSVDGQEMDTYVVIWKKTSTDPNPLTLEFFACDDDFFGGTTSQFTFTGLQGVTYYIEVAQFGGRVEDGSTGTPVDGTMVFNAHITNTDVYIGGNLMTSKYIPSGGRELLRYGIYGGPLEVKSTVPVFTSQRAAYLGSFNELMGFPANQLSTDYWFTYYDDIYMTTYLMIGNPDPVDSAHVEVYIGAGTTPYATYDIPHGQSILPRYGIADGPVRVKSTNGVKIFTSQRAAYGNSFNELMGFPANQLTTEYWFTYYDDIYMKTYLMIGNPDPLDSAHVEVYIGAGTTPYATYDIPHGQSILPRYGIANGPVRVKSTNGVKIFTSQRAAYGNSFNELMGFPANQLSTDYWFTYYDDIYMTTYLMIGNPDPVNSAHVEVYIGAGTTPYATYDIPHGQSILPRYGIANGPVRVKSTNGVNIFTSQRAAYGNSFNELMGFPANQMTTDYWFTYYDDIYMTTYLMIGAP